MIICFDYLKAQEPQEHQRHRTYCLHFEECLAVLKNERVQEIYARRPLDALVRTTIFINLE